jgi:hypothetical protein
MAGMIALARMTAGLVLWAIAFCVLYGLHGIGCAAGWAGVAAGPVSLHRMLLLLAWVACIAASLALALWLRRGAGHGLIERTAEVSAWVGLAATVVTGVPIVTLPVCV